MSEVDRSRNIPKTNKNKPSTPGFSIPRKWWIGGVGAIISGAIVLGIANAWKGRSPQEVSQNLPAIQRAFGDGILTVGVVTSQYNTAEKYDALKQYLQSELGNNTKVELDAIEFDSAASAQQAKNQLQNKTWDVAFTLSPALSIEAEDNNYVFAARMFPKTPQFSSVLFVKSDSSIQTLDNFTTETKIAVGGFQNFGLFYMPLYDLYGLSLKLDRDNSIEKIIQKVSSGEVDVGVGVERMLSNPENLKKFRILTTSRPIPISGVYLSPNLSEIEQNSLKASLLNAPQNIQEEAKYGEGNAINYENFQGENFVGITDRVDEVLGCAKFEGDRVQLFCPPETEIVGTVRNYEIREDGVYIYLRANNQIYRVIVPEDLLDRLVVSKGELRTKNIRVTDLEPTREGNQLTLRVQDSDRIKVE